MKTIVSRPCMAKPGVKLRHCSRFSVEAGWLRRRNHMFNTHPLRLTSICSIYDNLANEIHAIVNEAILKGYSVLVAANDKVFRSGFVIYRTIDGVELAYNPEWDNAFLAREQINLSDYVYIGNNGTLLDPSVPS